MAIDSSGIPLTLNVLQQELARINAQFGFEEKLIHDDIDTVDTWTEVTSGGGAQSILNGLIKLSTGAGSGDIIAETLNQILIANPNMIGVELNKPFNRFTMQWVAYISTVTAIDNTTFFMGMVTTKTHNRGNNSIAGFGLTADKLTSITDTTGTETTTDISTGFVPNAYNLFKIEFDGTKWDFYVNGVLKSSHTTNIPGGPPYFTVYNKNDSAADSVIFLQFIKAWYEV